MSLLDHPDAQVLLADAVLTPEAVRGCEGRLAAFLGRYLPRFRRAEQRANATLVIRGLLGGLQRKTCEPIAVEAGVHRKPIQFLVGAGRWDDEAVMAELRRHVAEDLGEDRAVLVIDATTFPKSGADSCGVGRQWCGRLGKQENCQRGIFLAYAAARGYAPLDRRLYLPKDWAGDAARRAKCHVPEGIEFREGWRIAAELVERSGPGLPHAWVVGDDEFGRPAQFRAWLRGRGEQYVLDVPSDTVVRDLECPRPPSRRPGHGRPRAVPFRRVDAWASGQPAGRWVRLTIRPGEKGPISVDAMAVRVRTRLEHRLGPEERLVVMRTVEAEPEIHYALSDAATDVPLEELVRARFARHKIEEVFEAAKGEVGLAQYEVRGWVGWHHHVTLSLLALWFLCCERRRVGGENPRRDGAASARGLHATAARPVARPRADRRGSVARPVAEGGGADLSLARGHRRLPAASAATGYQLIR
ncbi:IS701 family transposase [Paludisphaera mucosa]|uniref:IS701 family transposase n=1 Tax=Paludisphaera mucosa TaxID=3030827 RepID=A0ABT6FD46_9BACT|nr:IS701 family transposase [Paludisphaera mucosa]MDG3005480.1 IS701 family transposase [Paludisphaera mucosa]